MRNLLVAIFIVSPAAVALWPACTDSGICRIGTEGCICSVSGECESGLKCVGGAATADSADEGDQGFCEATSSSGVLCDNTCHKAKDESCDDGGEGSAFGICALGTDCDDCGARIVGPPGDSVCSDVCANAKDGNCDDGGEGHIYSTCDWGTDCTDCGERFGEPPSG